MACFLCVLKWEEESTPYRKISFKRNIPKHTHYYFKGRWNVSSCLKTFLYLFCKTLFFLKKSKKVSITFNAEISTDSCWFSVDFVQNPKVSATSWIMWNFCLVNVVLDY